MSDTRVIVSFQCEEALREELKEIAADLNTSVSKIIVEVLESSVPTLRKTAAAIRKAKDGQITEKALIKGLSGIFGDAVGQAMFEFADSKQALKKTDGKARKK